MNIFKMSEKELEKYLKENIDTKKTSELLEELIECGLESGEVMEERIVACAFKDTADGKIYLSRTCHAEIIGIFFGVQDKEIGHRCVQGFITNFDRFVDREEALQIARNAKQELHKICDTNELYSEDIFWNPLEEIKIDKQRKMIELMAEYISIQKWGNTESKESVIHYFEKKVGKTNGKTTRIEEKI